MDQSTDLFVDAVSTFSQRGSQRFSRTFQKFWYLSVQAWPPCSTFFVRIFEKRPYCPWIEKKLWFRGQTCPRLSHNYFFLLRQTFDPKVPILRCGLDFGSSNSI